ncbi:MAG: 1-acyl-sn-glycerol-3-phosphate acyltransferase [Saprospiraceae bacterium]|nr:1-acyl-sn-glycerol-3-phosphate acyltransferase [Saprospiraceae bacterium]
MNPILYVLYYFFKYFIRLCAWVYYAKVTITGERHHRSRNPCILVSNHPSTLLDPLNVAIRVNAEIKFLANASLFQNPVASWLLNRLYCIPIERHQDTGGKPLDNAASFRHATKHLSGGGCLYVAPEGSSFVERRLRKIKTGTARIAFAAEKANNWQLGLTVLPVGLNYSDPTKFRSELLTVFGESIRVADFREDYDINPVNAVNCLSEAIGEHIGAQIIDCEDGQQDGLLHHLETILQSEAHLPPAGQLRRTQAVLGRLRQWKADAPSAYEAFCTSVFAYFKRIKLLKISDLQIVQPQNSQNTIWLAAALPLFVAGWLSHILPCFFTKKITTALNGDYHWIPTYKFTAGVVLYPLFIWGQTWLVGKLAVHFDLGDWVKWAYLLAFVPLGLLAEWWLKTWESGQQANRADFLHKNEGAVWADIAGLRQQILATEQIFGK